MMPRTMNAYAKCPSAELTREATKNGSRIAAIISGDVSTHGIGSVITVAAQTGTCTLPPSVRITGR
jgi:hypothetical protein